MVQPKPARAPTRSRQLAASVGLICLLRVMAFVRSDVFTSNSSSRSLEMFESYVERVSTSEDEANSVEGSLGSDDEDDEEEGDTNEDDEEEEEEERRNVAWREVNRRTQPQKKSVGGTPF